MLIFGIVASGKTTLARELSRRLDTPWFEGDCIAWGFEGEERFKRTDEEQPARIRRIDENPAWIVEGTYRESQKILYELADAVVFLDTPPLVRRRRMVSRFLKQRLGLVACHYKPTFSMLKSMLRWTRDFERDRAAHEARLRQYADKLIWVHSAKELEQKFFTREGETNL
ncbi:MAG: AAA family ATPase [Eubacteriales bacterium]|nr:AAA family ATPase [Eubacteriales bacterium]